MSGETSNLQQSLPPLRLHHLFAWIGLTAVLLVAGSVRSGIDAIPTWRTIAWLPSMLGVTLTIVVAILLIMWRRSGFAVPGEPGHWIVIALCITLACSILWQFAMMFSVVETTQSQQLLEPQALTNWVSNWGWHLSVIPTIVANLLIAWRLRAFWPWCSFFGACGLLAFLHAFYGPVVLPLLSMVIPSLAAAAPGVFWAFDFVISANQSFAFVILAWAIWNDHQTALQRHWSHWCGMTAWTSSLPGSLAVGMINMGWIEFPVP